MKTVDCILRGQYEMNETTQEIIGLVTIAKELFTGSLYLDGYMPEDMNEEAVVDGTNFHLKGERSVVFYTRKPVWHFESPMFFDLKAQSLSKIESHYFGTTTMIPEELRYRIGQTGNVPLMLSAEMSKYIGTRPIANNSYPVQFNLELVNKRVKKPYKKRGEEASPE